MLAFDINLKEPSLLDYLPKVTETADVIDTFGKMQLMDRLIVNDSVAKVIDLGYHAFDEFFKMIDEIGFMKEAVRRGVAPIVLFVADTDRTSARAYETLRRLIPASALVTIDNEFVVRGELPPAMGRGRVVRGLGAAGVLEDLYRPAEFFLHRLSARREGFVDRAASVDPPELFQFPRAGVEVDFAAVKAVGRGRAFAISRHVFARALQIRCPSWRTEGAGNAGCALHPRSRVPKVCTLAHTSIQGSGNTPTSPAQWLYGVLRALPGERACLPPSPLRSLLLKGLAPASRRQDHTTWPYAPAFRPRAVFGTMRHA